MTAAGPRGDPENPLGHHRGEGKAAPASAEPQRPHMAHPGDPRDPSAPPHEDPLDPVGGANKEEETEAEAQAGPNVTHQGGAGEDPAMDHHPDPLDAQA